MSPDTLSNVKLPRLVTLGWAAVVNEPVSILKSAVAPDTLPVVTFPVTARDVKVPTDVMFGCAAVYTVPATAEFETFKFDTRVVDDTTIGVVPVATFEISLDDVTDPVPFKLPTFALPVTVNNPEPAAPVASYVKSASPCIKFVSLYKTCVSDDEPALAPLEAPPNGDTNLPPVPYILAVNPVVVNNENTFPATPLAKSSFETVTDVPDAVLT